MNATLNSQVNREGKQMTLQNSGAPSTCLATTNANAKHSSSAGAVSSTRDGKALDQWHAIDWQKATQNVKRLQARIVKATQARRYGKVKALQWLLTHSHSAKALAVKRVTENRGKRSAGVDGERWNTPAKKMKGLNQLRRHGYQAQALRRVYIPKKNGKLRPLGIPTMRDRAMQALYALALDPVSESIQDGNSYGFRMGRNAADASGYLFTALATRHCAQWVLEGDIKACFDQISHEWMMANIPMDKKLLLAWLKAGYVETGKLFASTAGTPQGGVISPILANLALNGLEAMLHKHFPQNSWVKQKAKINIVRYADDFVITGSSQAVLQNEILPKVAVFLSERGLQLSLEKTHITHIDMGFDFLGFNFRKYAGKLLITPSKASQQNIIQKLRTIIRANHGASAADLIRRLNPLIRGWTNYHKHVCSSQAFNHIDEVLYQMLRRWIRRRHSKSSSAWVRKTYFTHPHKRGWRFCARGRSAEGEIYVIELLHACEVPIRRHIKVRSAANPYAPEWERYYELRRQRRMRGQLVGIWRVRELFTRQAGVCLHCQQTLDEADGWEVHHVIWQVFGGSDEIGNLQLLHVNCHRQLHHRGADP